MRVKPDAWLQWRLTRTPLLARKDGAKMEKRPALIARVSWDSQTEPTVHCYLHVHVYRPCHSKRSWIKVFSQEIGNKSRARQTASSHRPPSPPPPSIRSLCFQNLMAVPICIVLPELGRVYSQSLGLTAGLPLKFSHVEKHPLSVMDVIVFFLRRPGPGNWSQGMP